MGQFRHLASGVAMALVALLTGAGTFTHGPSTVQDRADAEVAVQWLDMYVQKAGHDWRDQVPDAARRATSRPSRGSHQRSRAGELPARSQRRAERPHRQSRLPEWLRRCGVVQMDAARSHRNGSVPTRDLCQIPDSGHLLHPDAAQGWWLLSRRFKDRFGVKPCASDSYRSYQAQAQVYAAKPGLAARPGTSNHGWGVALDLCGGIESYTSPKHRWLERNGRKLGWDNPTWARSSGARPEPWHWEFRRTSTQQRRGDA